jgi:hypothetical protein
MPVGTTKIAVYPWKVDPSTDLCRRLSKEQAPCKLLSSPGDYESPFINVEVGGITELRAYLFTDRRLHRNILLLLDPLKTKLGEDESKEAS